jgi:hypothetical protein
MEMWQVQFFLSFVHPFFFCVFSGFPTVFLYVFPAMVLVASPYCG